MAISLLVKPKIRHRDEHAWKQTQDREQTCGCRRRSRGCGRAGLGLSFVDVNQHRVHKQAWTYRMDSYVKLQGTTVYSCSKPWQRTNVKERTYVSLGNFAVHQKVTRYCKLTIHQQKIFKLKIK